MLMGSYGAVLKSRRTCDGQWEHLVQEEMQGRACRRQEETTCWVSDDSLPDVLRDEAREKVRPHLLK